MASLSLVSNGPVISLACALLGLVYAAWLIQRILGAPSGTERMRGIASAVQRVAKAYLNRQILSLGSIGLGRARI